MRRQEPPRATLLDDMPGIACGALRDLKRESLRKSQEPPPQARALINGVKQRAGRNPQRLAVQLDKSLVRGGFGTEKYRGSDHALRSDHAHFDRRTVVERGDQRY